MMTALRLRSNEVEAANRAEATALLIRTGYRVYYPVADVEGEDLVVRTPAKRKLLAVQLKSRPTVDWPRYGGRSLWMLFPDPVAEKRRDWFLVPHDTLYDWIKRRSGRAPKWDGRWHIPRLSMELPLFLRRHRYGLNDTKGRKA